MPSSIELTNTDKKKIILNKEWIVEIQQNDNNGSRIFIGVPSVHGSKDSIASFYQIVCVLESYDSLKSILIGN